MEPRIIFKPAFPDITASITPSLSKGLVAGMSGRLGITSILLLGLCARIAQCWGHHLYHVDKRGGEVEMTPGSSTIPWGWTQG